MENLLLVKDVHQRLWNLPVSYCRSTPNENLTHALYSVVSQRIKLAITATVAAAALATVAFAAPQQVMAGGHHHNNHHNNSGGIKVDQQINQLNNCTNQPFCANLAENQAHIGH
jgi:hypothetical protein